MDKLKRQVGAAERKLRKAKTLEESRRILADLRMNKPDVYRALQNQKGS